MSLPTRHTDADTATRPLPPSRARRIGLTVAVTGVLAAITATYVVHNALPAAATALPYEQELHRGLLQVAPEGWAFFTRNPREPDTVPYRLGEGGTWQPALLAPHAQPRNAFGLNRRSRAQDVEIGQVEHDVPAAAWHDCDSRTTCSTAEVVAPLRNTAPHPTLCGRITLVTQRPVPWAWSAGEGATALPIRAASLDLRC